MSEIALAMFYLITNFLELLGNVIRALLHPSVNPKDVVAFLPSF
ncbi:MAG: hypothetical protein QXD49_01380 [Archaeoglobaceae archaeon]